MKEYNICKIFLGVCLMTNIPTSCCERSRPYCFTSYRAVILKKKVLTPKNLHRYSPYLLFVEMSSVWYYGTMEIIPHLYANSGNHVILMHQLFACIVGLEMIVNWLCIRYVDSGYDAERHGSMSDFHQIHEQKSVIKETAHEESRAIKRKPKSDDVAKTSSTRNQYPYWSWSPCQHCDRLRPPRCHHCALCNMCILKRDHHCYFARKCIGYKNWRYFAVFLFWSFIASIYSMLHGGAFVFSETLSKSSYFDIIPFLALLRCIFGGGCAKTGFLVIMWWILAYMAMLSFSHLVETFDLITSGRTTFEMRNRITVIDSRSKKMKIEAIFGKYWFLNIIVPLHLVSKAEENPVKWPTISGVNQEVLLQISTVQTTEKKSCGQ